jgi:hypothetical protein
MKIYKIVSRVDLAEIGWGDVDWISLAQDRYRWRALVKAVINLRVPQNAGILWSDCIAGGLSGALSCCGSR